MICLLDFDLVDSNRALPLVTAETLPLLFWLISLLLPSFSINTPPGFTKIKHAPPLNTISSCQTWLEIIYLPLLYDHWNYIMQSSLFQPAHPERDRIWNLNSVSSVSIYFQDRYIFQKLKQKTWKMFQIYKEKNVWKVFVCILSCFLVELNIHNFVFSSLW